MNGVVLAIAPGDVAQDAPTAAVVVAIVGHREGELLRGVKWASLALSQLA